MQNLKNTINLIGRAGINPVIRTFKNGVKLAKFSLATSETVIEVNGRKVTTQWHNIVAWGKKAELVEKYIKQGQLMAVDGKLINRIYFDASGNQRKLTEIQVNEILLINPNNDKKQQTVVKKLPVQNNGASVKKAS
ncbi:single-stranded DNA-binding protein [Paracrocinitomix mangrovi]|uniref:single-stranded DNA-binding protein n=1 Tax=Paracrocinitomix mangrovi TaxID=2862509 RepID=UPI001C8ED9C3|nr:single-stranded DNA-binding protein [Paracrocinitomix mangrovi]UKN01327.1 single-stranded DNA-binding protein [Paracrocinitomix mangrovi]